MAEGTEAVSWRDGFLRDWDGIGGSGLVAGAGEDVFQIVGLDFADGIVRYQGADGHIAGADEDGGGGVWVVIAAEFLHGVE